MPCSTKKFDAVQQDRVHVFVDRSLRAEVERTACFANAGGLLHSRREGFHREKSFKTKEPFGNLQLTFFTRDGDNVPTLVDADVDDAAGIEHAEQVIRNESAKFVRKTLGRLLKNLPEGKTNPYDIHQILIFYQDVSSGGAVPGVGPYKPAYSLRLRSAGAPPL